MTAARSGGVCRLAVPVVEGNDGRATASFSLASLRRRPPPGPRPPGPWASAVMRSARRRRRRGVQGRGSGG
eukprot:11169020-Lingulodinium_polyedra.AAC.1